MSADNPVELVWTVERASECLEFERVHVSICRFHMQCLKRTEWEVWLWMSPAGLHARLVRAARDEGPLKYEVDFDVDLIYAQGVRYRRAKRKRMEFQKRDSESVGLLATRSALCDTLNGLLNQGCLRISVRLWPVSDFLPQPVTLVARSSTGIKKRVTCRVPRFSTLGAGEIGEFSAAETRSLDRLGIVLSLMTERLYVRFHSIRKSLCVVVESISIVKTSGVETVFKGKMNFDTCFKTTTFCCTRRFMEDRASYLPDDTLTVVFDFTDFESYFKCHPERVIIGTVLPIRDVLTTNVNRHLESLARSLPDLLEQNAFSDFTLRVGSDSIPVHKFVLSAGSPVFRAMLMSPMTESSKNEAEVHDFRIDTVRRLVRFLYSGITPDLGKYDALELYSASDRYEVLQLRDHCARVLLACLSPQIASRVLYLSDRHSDESLKKRVLSYIRANERQVRRTDDWANLEREYPDLAQEVFEFCQANKFKIKN